MSSKPLQPLKQTVHLFILVKRWENTGWITLQQIRWESREYNHLIKDLINSSHLSKNTTNCHSHFQNRIKMLQSQRGGWLQNLKPDFLFKPTLSASTKVQLRASRMRYKQLTTLGFYTLWNSHGCYEVPLPLGRVFSIFLHWEFPI